MATELSRQELATIAAALVYWRHHGHPMNVRLPPAWGREVPLSHEQLDALIARLLGGEDVAYG